MKEKICFLSIDTEEDYLVGQSQNSFGGVEVLIKLDSLWDKYQIKPTFFCTGEVLKKYPEFFKNYWAKGYEVAVHGFYDHENMLNQSVAVREEKLIEHLELYRNVFNVEPIGFRAVQNTVDQAGLELLAKHFKYDSSIISYYPPFKKYIGYSKQTPAQPYKLNDLLEIPLNPLFGGVQLQGKWLRSLGIGFYKFLLKIKQPELISLSFHSWDLLDNNEIKNGGDNFAKILDEIIGYLKKQGYIFKNGQEFYEQFKGNN